jgi:hypothetical protein
MSTHAHPNTSESNPVVLGAQRQAFNAYVPQAASDSVKDEGFASKADIRMLPNVPHTKHSPFEGLTDFYWAVTRIFGFNEKYSLGLCACKTLIALLSAYSFCSDFLWGRSYWILSRTDPDDEPSQSA